MMGITPIPLTLSTTYLHELQQTNTKSNACTCTCLYMYCTLLQPLHGGALPVGNSSTRWTFAWFITSTSYDAIELNWIEILFKLGRPLATKLLLRFPETCTEFLLGNLWRVQGLPLWECFVYLFCAGSYFVYDNPAALQRNMINDLNIDYSKFMLQYSLYSWPNVVLSLLGGYLIDRVFGIRCVWCSLLLHCDVELM